MPGRLADIERSICISNSQRSLCVSFSRTDSGLCKFNLLVWSNCYVLHNCQLINLSTHSFLILNSFCVNLLHSLIIWLMVLSLSLRNLHLLFCCVLSILALICLALITLFCAALRRYFVFLSRFPFHSQVKVFSCEMLLFSRLKRR